MYEYKLFPAPRQVRRGNMVVNGPEALAGTISGQVNLISGNGWEFLSTQSLPVQRRRWRILTVTEHEDILVFRRPLSNPPASNPSADAGATSHSDDPSDRAETVPDPRPRVRPRRVRPTVKAGEKMDIVSRRMRAEVKAAE